MPDKLIEITMAEIEKVDGESHVRWNGDGWCRRTTHGGDVIERLTEREVAENLARALHEADKAQARVNTLRVMAAKAWAGVTG